MAPAMVATNAAMTAAAALPKFLAGNSPLGHAPRTPRRAIQMYAKPLCHFRSSPKR